MLVRLLPVRGGKPYRFGFRNLWLDAHSHNDVAAGGLLSVKARVESIGSQVVLRPLEGYVAVNGEHIRDPRPLAHGDIIAFRDNRGQETAYEFECDLRLAKVTRWQAEGGRGLHRGPPDVLGLEGQSPKRHDCQIAVDAAGMTVTEKGRRGESFLWDELDAVRFLPITQPRYAQSGSDVGREIAAGIQAGLRAVEETAEASRRDIAASDVNPEFNAPSYQVALTRNGKDLERVSLEKGRCALLAQAIEYFAPIDLTWFGEQGPEKTQLSANAQPVSLERRTRIETIVDRYAISIHDEHAFFRPAIPPGKLSKALEQFAPGVSPEAVLLLIDDTWRKSGEEGVLLTAGFLYGRVGAWRHLNAVALDNIEPIDIQLKGSKVIEINGTAFHVFSWAKRESVRQLVGMLQEIVALRPAVVTPDDASG